MPINTKYLCYSCEIFVYSCERASAVLSCLKLDIEPAFGEIAAPRLFIGLPRLDLSRKTSRLVTLPPMEELLGVVGGDVSPRWSVGGESAIEAFDRL